MDTYRWKDKDGVVHGMTVRGQRALVRKCERNDGDFLVGEAPDELPDWAMPLGRDVSELMVKSQMQSERIAPQQRGIGATNWCHVLAISKDASGLRSDYAMRHHKNKDGYGVRRGVLCPFGVGDYVVLPETTGIGAMWRGVTGSKFDFLIDVAEIIAYKPDTQTGTLTPMGEQILVAKDDSEKEFGGITIPDIGLDRAMTGVVVCLGTGVLSTTGDRMPFGVSVNDRVVFRRDVGIDVQIDGAKQIILKQQDILAVAS